MKVSLNLYPGRTIDEIIEICKFLDTNGWHGAYLSDHFMPHNMHVKSGRMVECWTTLADIARNTNNIQISSFVSPFSFRHPGIIANMASNIDEISKGRLILGVGAGWQENEHLAYGFDLLSPKERIDRFEEGIQVLIGLLRNEQFSFSGKYYNLSNATCNPQKYNREIPIMVGCWTGNKRMVNIGYKYGDIINLIGASSFISKNLKKEKYIYKNVALPIVINNNIIKQILFKYKNNFPKNYYTIFNLPSLKHEISNYKKLGFEEIIIGDMSFINDIDDLFIVLENIKQNIIECSN